MKSSILIIDDSKEMRLQVADILKKSGLFTYIFEAGDGIEGFRMALDKEPEIILCDIEMPGMNGYKFLHLRNARKGLQDVPVIMVTSREESQDKVLGLELGASDYVTKPFDPGELIARIKVQLKIKSLQDRLRRSNELLLELSHTDPLTGLNNRRQMMAILKREMDRSCRTGESLSLIMVDADDFKKINDLYGHRRGDEVLKILGNTLKNQLREYDSVARFGGEEFILILPATDLPEAENIAERVRREVAGIVDADIEGLRVTISLGVATYSSRRVQSPDDLIRKADYALYQAKREGRNRVVAAPERL